MLYHADKGAFYKISNRNFWNLLHIVCVIALRKINTFEVYLGDEAHSHTRLLNTLFDILAIKGYLYYGCMGAFIYQLMPSEGG